MKLKVLGWDEFSNHHKCEILDKRSKEVVNVDLFANGTIPKQYDERTLIGKIVEVEYLATYLYLAMNVESVVEE